MSIVNSSFIRTYCLGRFTDNYRLSNCEMELVIPSIFLDDDYNRHMSINLENGLWRCFKTGNVGNFPKLISILEKCSYRTAYERFVFENLLIENVPDEPEKVIATTDIEDTTKFTLLEENHPFIVSRMLEGSRFYISDEGFYAGRLIIPFFNSAGKLFYFQARSINGRQPKYLNCRSLKSSQVLYPFNYESYEPLYITEGVFDCLSLRAVGLNATTTLSCETSKEQMEQLRHYQGPLVNAFDNDEAGRRGTRKFMTIAHNYNRTDLKFIHPPGSFKDWNEILLKEGPDELISITRNVSTLDAMMLEINELQIQDH